MDFAGILPRRAAPFAVVCACAIGLSGCFDLAQKVAVNTSGGGSYAVVVSANGVVGDAISKKHADVDIDEDSNNEVTRVTHEDGKVVQTTEIAFKELSDLHLDDETISLTVKGKKLLGLGGTEVNFHRTFHVDEARHHHHDLDDGDDDDKNIGRDILTSMFGDHTYTFSVWLPGSIEHIAPLQVNGHTVHPTVWTDKYGHTIIWKMDLVDMFLARQIDFDVDFAAHGDFHDATTSSGDHHSRHGNET